MGKPGRCVIKTCKNSIKSKNDSTEILGLTYHRFPKKPEIRAKWAKALNLNNVTDGHLICSHHFSEVYFDRSFTDLIRLKKNAVPCISEINDSMENEVEISETKFSIESEMEIETNFSLENIPELNAVCSEENYSKLCLSPFHNESDATNLKTDIKQENVTDEIEFDLPRNNCKARATSISPERRFYSPTKELIRQCHKQELNEEKKKRTAIRQKLYNAEKKITRLQETIAQLKEEQFQREKELKREPDIDNLNKDLLKREMSKVRNEKIPRTYTDELRSFAITLHEYSPKAYEFVREKFHSALPHVQTIHKWHRTTSREINIGSENNSTEEESENVNSTKEESENVNSTKKESENVNFTKEE